MSDYQKKQRALRRRIAELDKEQDAASLKYKDMRPDEIGLQGIAVAQYQSQRKHFEMELEVLEAKHLLDMAAKWGVEGSAQQRIYDPNMAGLEPRPYFVEPHKTQMRKMISDARKKRINEWVGILSPLITVLLSLAALIVSIIALAKK
jgi:hypothetical protein